MAAGIGGVAKKKKAQRKKEGRILFVFLFRFCGFVCFFLFVSFRLLLYFCSVFLFATNPLSTTSCAVAHKGAETPRTWREGRKTMTTRTRRKSEESRELRSKAPGHRVSMQSV